MRLIKRLLTLLWVLAIFVTGCILYLFNSDPVGLNLVWLEIPPTSLALVIIVTFFIGIVTGTILTFIASCISEK